MEHSFDVEIAKKYGIPAAVLLKHIQFWIEKNRANNKNFFDGYYWTYNSKAAFTELFPYMTARQIDYALQKLIDNELIITGNYNQLAYDRTLWYAITKKGYCILQNCEMETTKLLNGNNKIVEPIPDINTDINTDIKKERKKNSFDKIINAYSTDEKTVDLLQEWLKVRKAKRAAMTNRAVQMNIDKLDKIAKESGLSVNDYLAEVICRGWAAFYPINNYGSGSNGKTYGKNGIAITNEKSELDELF